MSDHEHVLPGGHMSGAVWVWTDDVMLDPARHLAQLHDATADVLTTAIRRLQDLASFTEARAEAGHEHLRSHVTLYRRDARWIADEVDRLERQNR